MAGSSVEEYRPLRVDAAVWAAVGPLAREWVGTVPVGVVSEAVQRLKPLAQYLAWRVAGGMTVTDAAVVFRLDEIDRFILVGCGHLAGGTRATYRSALRSIGEHVVGFEVACPDRAMPAAKPTPLAPYSDAEFASILGAISGRPTLFQRNNAMALVVFGRGAGLGAGDIAGLIGTDCHRTADGTVIIGVPGARPREVPVLRRWEAQAYDIAAAAGDGPVFNSTLAAVTCIDIARFCERLSWSDAPGLSVSRLRITWIVEHLSAGAPLHVLAQAAGVTAPNLARYARFLDPVPPARARDTLRRGAGPR